MATSQYSSDSAPSDLVVSGFLRGTINFYALLAILISCTVLAVASPIASIILAVVSFVAIAVLKWPNAIALIFVSLFAQNMIVSFLSPALNSVGFNMMRGTSFIFIGLAAVLIALEWLLHPNRDRKATAVCVFLIAGLVIFSAIGAVKNPYTAAVYFRNALGPIAFIMIGSSLSEKMERELEQVVTAGIWFVIFCALADLIAPRTLYALMSLPKYVTLSVTNLVFPITSVDQLINGYTIRLFNLNIAQEYGITARRLLLPALHPISSGYLIAGLCLFAGAYRKKRLALILFGLAWVYLAKGPLVMLFGGGLAVALAAWWPGSPRSSISVFLAVIATYIAGAVLYGLHVHDFHVIGFLGGINGFLHNPFGHGLGAGGNLGAREQLDWKLYQAEGMEFGVESAAGVVLYQLGALGIFYLWTLVGFAYTVLKAGWQWGSFRDVWIGGCFLVLCANGIFQEEALLSPYAVAIPAMLVGLQLRKWSAKTSLSEVRVMGEA